MLYTMLCGSYKDSKFDQYIDKRHPELVQSLKVLDKNEYNRLLFPHADWHSISSLGRDLVKGMLELDPDKRWVRFGGK